MRKIQCRRLTLYVALTLIGFAAGCGSNPRVVMIPPIEWVDGVPTDLLKIGPGMTGRVYVHTAEGWVLSDNKVTLPEGWLASPPPPKDQ